MLLARNRRPAGLCKAIRFRWETRNGVAVAVAADLTTEPAFANGIPKTMLHQEWAMTIKQAIAAETQTLCMLTQDLRRAYEAFAARRKPVFGGN